MTSFLLIQNCSGHSIKILSFHSWSIQMYSYTVLPLVSKFSILLIRTQCTHTVSPLISKFFSIIKNKYTYRYYRYTTGSSEEAFTAQDGP